MPEAVAKKRSAGRPLKKSDQGALSKILGFRLRPTLRSKLERAAQVERRSISEECEYRLNRSFEREEAVAEIFGHSAHRPLVLAICHAIRMVEAIADERGDIVQAYAAVIRVVEGLAEEKSAVKIKEAADAGGNEARNVAAAILAVEAGEPLPRSLPLSETTRR